jgi:hypothetical protein
MHRHVHGSGLMGNGSQRKVWEETGSLGEGDQGEAHGYYETAVEERWTCGMIVRVAAIMIG